MDLLSGSFLLALASSLDEVACTFKVFFSTALAGVADLLTGAAKVAAAGADSLPHTGHYYTRLS
jgi:hypothetical protein